MTEWRECFFKKWLMFHYWCATVKVSTHQLLFYFYKILLFQYKNNTAVQSFYGPGVFDYVAVCVSTISDALTLEVGVEGRMNIIKGVAMIGFFDG